MLIKHEMCPFVKNFFSRRADNPGQSENCPKKYEKQVRFCGFLQTLLCYIDFPERI